jgi:hypothetical protein
MQQIPIPRLEVKAEDHGVKIQRKAVAQRVIDFFGPSLPDSRLLCFLDEVDPPTVRGGRGPANRALYGPIHDISDLEGWPNYVRDCIYSSDPYGGRARVIDDLVYLHGSTCVDDVGLTISLAHELQHAIQHFKLRELWAVNGLVANDLSRATIEGLRLEWADIPIEVDARIVSKRVAECFFGELRVRQHIDKKTAEPATEGDRRDWQFIRTLMPSMTVDLAGETQRLLDRVKDYRSELEASLQEKRQNPDYTDIDLDAFFIPPRTAE